MGQCQVFKIDTISTRYTYPDIDASLLYTAGKIRYQPKVGDIL